MIIEVLILYIYNFNEIKLYRINYIDLYRL